MAFQARSEASTPGARFDAVGIFWVVFCFVWTLMLAGGMTFLYRRREMPILRVRGLLLSFGAVMLLHFYWMVVQWVYILAPVFPPAVEFWIMSIWLPFGVGLFHASNSRFLYVAQTQKKYFASEAPRPKSERSRKGGLIGRYKSLDYTTRMLVLVGIGMAVQVCFMSLCMMKLTVSAFPHHFHVSRFSQVSPFIWN